MSPSFVFALLSATLALSTVVSGEVQEKRSVVDISHRAIPWLDYEGIAAAAERSLEEDLIRKGLSTEGYNWQHKHKRQSGTCASVQKRLEWRQLSDPQKIDYLNATKCLYSRSSVGAVPDAQTIVDEMVTVHNTKWQEFHGVAAFLPWHRWFVWINDQMLRNECGYNGPPVYWNYTADWQDPLKSPIFDEDKGFGKHGTTKDNTLGGGYRIEKGFFAGIQVNVPITHYILRDYSGAKVSDPSGRFGNALGNTFSPSEIQKAIASRDFWSYAQFIDGLGGGAPGVGGIHNGPHFMQMGDWTGPSWVQSTRYAGNSYAPNDPMFFPHHGGNDLVWWQWQQKSGNQFSYGGNKGFGGGFPGGPGGGGGQAQSSDILPFYSLGPDLPVSAMLKTENYPLCYTY